MKRSLKDYAVMALCAILWVLIALPAHAEIWSGQWVDINNHVALGQTTPDNATWITSFTNALTACRVAVDVSDPKVNLDEQQSQTVTDCLKSKGYVYIFNAAKDATAKTAYEDRVAKTVQHCLDFVHNFQVSADTYPSLPDVEQKSYKNFDAFYNRGGDGSIKDNALTNGDAVGPRFQFHKCMADQGVPLKANS